MNFISNFKAMTIPETIHYGRQKSYYLLKYKAFQARIGVENAEFFFFFFFWGGGGLNLTPLLGGGCLQHQQDLPTEFFAYLALGGWLSGWLLLPKFDSCFNPLFFMGKS